jgi:hypothetical protein
VRKKGRTLRRDVRRRNQCFWASDADEIASRRGVEAVATLLIDSVAILLIDPGAMLLNDRDGERRCERLMECGLRVLGLQLLFVTTQGQFDRQMLFNLTESYLRKFGEVN